MFESGNEVLDVFIIKILDVLLLDICMFGMDGLVLFKQIKQCYLMFLVIIMIVYFDLDVVVSVYQQGVFDYLFKFFDIDEVVVFVDWVISYY